MDKFHYKITDLPPEKTFGYLFATIFLVVAIFFVYNKEYLVSILFFSVSLFFYFISRPLLKKKLSSYLTFQSDSRAIKVSSTLDSLSVNSPLYVLTFLGVKRPLLKFERSRRCVRRVFGANRALFVFFVVAFDMRFVLTPNSFFFFLTFPQKKKKNKKRQREREREDILLLLLLLRYI